MYISVHASTLIKPVQIQWVTIQVSGSSGSVMLIQFQPSLVYPGLLSQGAYLLEVIQKVW